MDCEKGIIVFSKDELLVFQQQMVGFKNAHAIEAKSSQEVVFIYI